MHPTWFSFSTRFDRIWALDYNGGSPVNTLLLDTNLSLSSFGVDGSNELYLVDHGGIIYRFIPPPMSSRRYVAPTGDDTVNDCSDAMAPCLTIGHAVNLANVGDTLHVAPGTYLEPGLVIEKQVLVQGQRVVVQ